MLAAVITFLVAIGINVLSSLHSVSDIKINENIKTFSMKVSADTSIDIGTKKIEDVFLNVFKKYLKDFKLEEKKTDADLELTFKIDEFTTKESERLVRLPLYFNMDSKDLNKVITCIKQFLEKC